MNEEIIRPAERLDALKKEFATDLKRNLSIYGVTTGQLIAATGKKKASIDKWYRGEVLPKPENFAVILDLINPPEKELQKFIDLWTQLHSAQGSMRQKKH